MTKVVTLRMFPVYASAHQFSAFSVLTKRFDVSWL